MRKKPTPNYDVMLDSAVELFRVQKNEWKALFDRQYKLWGVGEDGLPFYMNGYHELGDAMNEKKAEMEQTLKDIKRIKQERAMARSVPALYDMETK